MLLLIDKYERFTSMIKGIEFNILSDEIKDGLQNQG